MSPLRRLASALVGFYRREPARCNSFIATAVAALLLRLGVRIEDGDVLSFVALVMPYIVASVVTRQMVVPVATVNTVIADEVRGIESEYATGGSFVTDTPLIVGERGPDQVRLTQESYRVWPKDSERQ